MAGIQLDNQLPLTPMPVLFRHQKSSDELDHVLKLTVTVQSDGSSEFCVYPYIGVQVIQGFPSFIIFISIYSVLLFSRRFILLSQKVVCFLFLTRMVLNLAPNFLPIFTVCICLS